MASFEVTAPATVALGQTFDLSVRAVGSAGTVPLTGFDGGVVGSDRGVLTTPGFAELE